MTGESLKPVLPRNHTTPFVCPDGVRKGRNNGQLIRHMSSDPACGATICSVPSGAG